MKCVSLEVVSLYEAIMMIGLLFLSVAGKNLFTLIFCIALTSKQIPEKILKKIVPIPEKLRARPKGATDCNLLNKGGEFGEKPGFPSGHTTTAWFLFVYNLLEFFRLKKQGISIYGSLIVTGLFALLMPIARFGLKCHTIEQIIGGMVLGTLWAGVFYWFEQGLLMDSHRYREDKQKVINFLNMNN